jgi:hypothetical protein
MATDDARVQTLKTASKRSRFTLKMAECGVMPLDNFHRVLGPVSSESATTLNIKALVVSRPNMEQ